MGSYYMGGSCRLIVPAFFPPILIKVNNRLASGESDNLDVIHPRISNFFNL